MATLPGSGWGDDPEQALRVEVSKSPWALLRGPLSPYSWDLQALPSHIFPPWDNAPGQSGLPSGQRELTFGHLQMHFVHLQMHFCASGSPPDALLCIWLTSRCTVVHLAMPFGHLDLPGGVPRGGPIYDVSEFWSTQAHQRPPAEALGLEAHPSLKRNQKGKQKVKLHTKLKVTWHLIMVA